ncbi:MAG: DUF1080 domain-containing protein [Phycisphaerales bacterium]|nr:DUF1080 domain-containing protein [Phycisphaerales bacterium]
MLTCGPRWLKLFTAALAVLLIAQDKPAPSPPTVEWTFDKCEVGKPVAGWRIAATRGSDKPAKWLVAADASAPGKPNVLKVETTAEDQTFNLLIGEQLSLKDVDLRVMLRADSGKVDQGGGLLWRCKDENNYYVCRVNPLESNFRVYKIEGGKRTQLGSADVETKTGEWHEVRAVMIASKIECFVDGKKLLEAADDTFKDAGRIGLWTKADASSSFDKVIAQAPSSGGKADEGKTTEKPEESKTGEKPKESKP